MIALFLRRIRTFFSKISKIKTDKLWLSIPLHYFTFFADNIVLVLSKITIHTYLRNNIGLSGVNRLFNTGTEFWCVRIDHEGCRPEWLLFSHQNDKTGVK
jgi:hypothetical protein